MVPLVAMHGIMDNYHLHKLSVKISANGLGYNYDGLSVSSVSPTFVHRDTIIELAMGQHASVMGYIDMYAILILCISWCPAEHTIKPNSWKI